MASGGARVRAALNFERLLCLAYLSDGGAQSEIGMHFAAAFWQYFSCIDLMSVQPTVL